MKKHIIHQPGLVLYEDGELIIDTTLWTTQAALAQKLGVSRNTINNRVRRGIAHGRIRSYYIEQIRTRLVRNVLDINDLEEF